MTGDPGKGPLTKDELRRLAEAKKSPQEQPLATWDVATTDVPNGGLKRERDATSEERTKIAALLGLVSLDALSASYRISAITGGGWKLSGAISANAVQSCVVTGEPVADSLSDEFKVEFWRELEEPEGGEDKSVLEGADVEPLEGDTIAVGRIVFETLSAALNPYPRKEGAAFEWQDKNAAEGQKANPFSVLGKLKDKS